MKTTLETSAKAPASSLLDIRINPAKVGRYARAPKTLAYHTVINLLGRPRYLRKCFKPLKTLSKSVIQGGRWDLKAGPIEDSSAFGRMQDLYRHRNDYRESVTYREAAERVSKGLVYKYKKVPIHSIEELDTFFENYLMDLLFSMEDHGYLDAKGTTPCCVLISRDGEVIKGRKGRHRFSAAKITGVDSIPVQISHIHKDFAAKFDIESSHDIDPQKLRNLVTWIEEKNR